MKPILLIVSLIVVLLASSPFFMSDRKSSLTGLPWQIEVLADGSTQVFGLNLGRSKLADALRVIGDDMEVAVMAAKGESGRLEMYFTSYRVGLLSGKLVVQTSPSPQLVESWKQNAVESDYVGSGRAKKYVLSEPDLAMALQQRITGFIFIPSVNLDEEVILSRFGQPDERVEAEDAVHFRYPAKGLDIALSEEAKEVLSYSIPAGL